MHDRFLRATSVDPSSVSTREEFADFVAAALEDFRGTGEDEWENATLERFLDALAALAAARVVDAPDQESPSWRLFAEILAGATDYE